jgi:hypothetical protein
MSVLCVFYSWKRRGRKGGGVVFDRFSDDLNVDRPHKVAICSRLDDLTEDGRNIGACNTVLIRKGPNGERLLGSSSSLLTLSPPLSLLVLEADGKQCAVGHNTDSVGVRESLLRADDSHVKSGKVRPGAVLGAGGACRFVLSSFLLLPLLCTIRREDDKLTFPSLPAPPSTPSPNGSTVPPSTSSTATRPKSISSSPLSRRAVLIRSSLSWCMLRRLRRRRSWLLLVRPPFPTLSIHFTAF